MTTDQARERGYEDGYAGRDQAPPMVGAQVEGLRDAYQDGYEHGTRTAARDGSAGRSSTRELPELVWAAVLAVDGDGNVSAMFHLMPRRGEHVAVCGAEMPFADTRYFEAAPEVKCEACVASADADYRSYPGPVAHGR